MRKLPQSFGARSHLEITSSTLKEAEFGREGQRVIPSIQTCTRLNESGDKTNMAFPSLSVHRLK